MGRRFDSDSDMLITLLKSLYVLNTFTLHAKDLARLGTSRNFHFDFAIQCRHVEFGAERSLDETDRHVADDIKIVTNKNRVRLDLNDHVKIARCATNRSGFA